MNQTTRAPLTPVARAIAEADCSGPLSVGIPLDEISADEHAQYEQMAQAAARALEKIAAA